MAWTVDQKLQLANVALLGVTFVVGAAAFGVGYSQLRDQETEWLQQHEKEHRQQALSFFINQVPQLEQPGRRLEDAFPAAMTESRARVPLETILLKFAVQPKLADDLRTLLNHWESLALTVAAGLSDEDLVFEMWGYTVVRLYTRYQEVIDYWRVVRNPLVYTYLVPLVGKWKTWLEREKLLHKQGDPLFYLRPSWQRQRTARWQPLGLTSFAEDDNDCKTLVSQQFRAVIKELDTNKDGRVGREEAQGLSKDFDRIDQNHDNSLDEQELLEYFEGLRQSAIKQVSCP